MIFINSQRKPCLKKSLILPILFCLLGAKEKPLVSISPIGIKDLIAGENKSGIIVGGGVGLPSLSVQHLSGHRFSHTTSYGYHFLAGYQDFAKIINPFYPNLFGARAYVDFSDTYHIALIDNVINSTSILLNYDFLFDVFARRKINTMGFILGANIGWTKISNYQSFSFSIGMKFGISLAFDSDNRLDITYKIASSGPLKGNDLYFYSPHTINLTYTYRFSLPQNPPMADEGFDNTKLLIKQ